MDIQGKLCAVVLCGVSSGLIGCQAPSSGLAFWKSPGRGESIASSSPDVGKQKYDGLAKEFPSSMPGKGSTAALGGGKPAESGNIFTSTWSKTTAAVSSAFGRKPADELVENDPTSLSTTPKKVGPEVYLGAAKLFENQGKLADAQQQYEKAIKASPTDLNALVGLARLQDRQGQPAQAVELYLRAAKAHPNSALVQNDLGLCFARQHQWQNSLQALGRASELSPGDAKYRNNLAMVLVEMGRPDEALPHLAATNSPAVAHYNLGYLLSQKGQRDMAVRHFQRALELDANIAPAREMLAQLGGPEPSSVPQGPYAAQSEQRVAARPVSMPIPSPTLQVPPTQSPPARLQGTSYTIGDDTPVRMPAPQGTATRSSYYEGLSDEAVEEILPLPPVEG